METALLKSGREEGSRTRFGDAPERSKRDFSTTRSDSFAGANEEKQRRTAPVEMTGLRRAVVPLALAPRRLGLGCLFCGSNENKSAGPLQTK